MTVRHGIALGAAGISVLIALTAMAGLATGHIGWSAWLGDQPMVFNTGLAILFLAGAAALTECRMGWAPAVALPAIIFGFVTLAEAATGYDTGLDNLFFHHTFGQQPGDMAPNAALCFCLLGLSFFTDPNWHLRALLPWTAAGLAVLALVGYAFHFVPLYHWTSTSIATATAMAILGVAVSELLRDE